MFRHYPRYLVIKILNLYQRTLSRDHGFFKFLAPYGYCKFSPTCSQYAIEAIERYGIFSGGVKALWRVLRCHPWSKGGWDPVK
jgi:putative membrane protein insertion efficiency factor